MPETTVSAPATTSVTTSAPSAASAAGATPDGAQPRTTVPVRSQRGRPQQPRPLSILRAGDVLALIGALAAALATTALLWTEGLAPFTGILGFVVVAWCLFVLFYAVLISFDENRPTMRDRISAVVVQSLGVVVLGSLTFIIIFTFFEGRAALVHANFYTQDMHTALATDPLTKGGMLHAMAGTLIETGIAMAVAVPLGLLAAVFLAEVPGRLSRIVRTIVEAMTAVPDVLAGLFVYAVLLILAPRYSGFAAACALAVTALPIICRAADVVLRLVPGGLTEASYALGAGQWRTVRLVTLPTARSGLATAIILGAARAIGETAPVLLTAGVTDNLNLNPFSGPMMSLPLMTYIQTSQAQASDIARGFGAGAVLLALVLVLFSAARAIGGRGAGQLSGRQRRRRMAASRRDLARYERRARSAGALSQGFPGGMS